MAYGWILVDLYDETKIISSGHRTCGTGTSNIAEYRALIAGIQGSLKVGINIIHIMGDSQLIVNQVIGTFKVKKEELKQHRDYVRKILEQFDDYTIKWIPRKENHRADSLVNEVFKRRQQKCSDIKTLKASKKIRYRS